MISLQDSNSSFRCKETTSVVRSLENREEITRAERGSWRIPRAASDWTAALCSVKIQRGTTDRPSVVIEPSKSRSRAKRRERESERVTRWIGKLTRLHRLRQIDLLDKDWVTELESRPNTIVVSNLTPSSSDNLIIINRACPPRNLCFIYVTFLSENIS